MARFSISGPSDGEGSSDGRARKRQRLRSIIEDEDGEAEFTGNLNAGRLREEEEDEENRNRRDENGEAKYAGSDRLGEDEDEDDDRKSSDDDSDREEMTTESWLVNDGDMRNSSLTVTLTDPDVLDCVVCCEPLKIPIFQCDNGHIACSSCCAKLRHKCPSCSMPIGYYRCRAMERVLEAVRIPCPNAKYGCAKKFPYGKRSSHEKKCIFTLCSCPVRDCNFTGTCKHLSSHFSAEHRDCGGVIVCDKPEYFSMSLNNEMKVFQEEKEGELIVVQSFREPHGACLSVSCISPLARGAGEFSYNLQTILSGSTTLTYNSRVKRIQEASVDPPVECFMLIPSYLLLSRRGVKLRLCITRYT